ncbi:hypothetical protein ACE193_13270 [Bernardetia sp. OM2101]|uniref:hypothetical protein n=1 Tax=Bernardetia sp. OM2101 TaxID=3344876 RepID=UPI0035CE9207
MGKTTTIAIHKLIFYKNKNNEPRIEIQFLVERTNLEEYQQFDIIINQKNQKIVGLDF